MQSKQSLNQLKSAKAAAVQVYKKRKSKASLVLNMVYKVKDNELNITDTSNTKGSMEPGSRTKVQIRVIWTLKKIEIVIKINIKWSKIRKNESLR